MKTNKRLKSHEVKVGDVVAVYLTTLQKVHHEQYDIFMVDFVSLDGWNLESLTLGIGAVPFEIQDVIAVWRRKDGGVDYNMVWFDENYKDVLGVNE